VNWSIEAEQDLMAMYDIRAEKELLQALNLKIQEDIDRELIRRLKV
jgi:hypothetical protein